MAIHIKLAAFRNIPWHQHVIRLLLGGAITVATGLIANRYGPVVGGLFLAFPAIFPASATLVAKQEQDQKHRAGIAATQRGRLLAALDARGASLGAVALIGFATGLWCILPAHAPAVALGTALALWLILAISIWRLRRLHVYLHKRG